MRKKSDCSAFRIAKDHEGQAGNNGRTQTRRVPNWEVRPLADVISSRLSCFTLPLVCRGPSCRHLPCGGKCPLALRMTLRDVLSKGIVSVSCKKEKKKITPLHHDDHDDFLFLYHFLYLSLFLFHYLFLYRLSVGLRWFPLVSAGAVRLCFLCFP